MSDSKHITFRIRPDQHRAMQRIKTQVGVSINQQVVNAIDLYIADIEEKFGAPDISASESEQEKTSA